MAPEPPRRKPSSTLIVREEVAVGAVHELKPIQPIGERATVKPPPIPADVTPPSARRVPRAPTLLASPAPPAMPPPLPMRDKLDSHDISTDALLTELAETGNEKRAAVAEAEELRRQLRELDRSNRLPRVEVITESKPPKRTDWAKAALGLVTAVSVFLGGLGTYLGARAATKEEKVDNVAAKQLQQQAVTDPLSDKVTAADRYNRSLAAALDCRLRHIRAALERDGMTIESLPAGAVDWRSRYLPGRSVRAVPEWLLSDDCPALPTPP